MLQDSISKLGVVFSEIYDYVQRLKQTTYCKSLIRVCVSFFLSFLFFFFFFKECFYNYRFQDGCVDKEFTSLNSKLKDIHENIGFTEIIFNDTTDKTAIKHDIEVCTEKEREKKSETRKTRRKRLEEKKMRRMKNEE